MLKRNLLTLSLCTLFSTTLFADTVSFEKPKDFHKQVEASGCFLEHDGKYLFLLRNPHKPQGGTWAIPGGKVDAGETAKQAAVREFYEETGVKLNPSTMNFSGDVYLRTDDNVDVLFHVFSAQTDKESQVTLSQAEHSDYKWMSLDQALQKKLIPGEVELIEHFYPETQIG